MQGVFGRRSTACRSPTSATSDLGCYGKKLNDPSWTRAEKAAFAIAFSGDAKKGVPLLLARDEADHDA